MNKDTTIIKEHMPYWEYQVYDDEVIKRVFDWLQKPPHSFKYTDSFDTNIQLLAKAWNLTLHFELTNGKMMAKECALFEVFSL